MEQLIDQIAKAPPAAKFGGLAGAVVLLTALNYFLMISPVEDRIMGQSRTQRQLEVQLAEKTEIAQNLNERRREMDVLEQRLAEALTMLPERKDIDDLLSGLNDIGKKTGLEIAQVEPQAETASGFYAKIPVKMAVTGNYHEIAMFLQEVSGMRRIVNVNNIHLGTPDLKNEKVVLKSEFLATAFRFLDQPVNQGDKKGAK